MPVAQKPSDAPRSEPITSRENRWLKRFRAALREHVMEDDIVGLEGPHLVEEAFRSGLSVAAILYSPSGEKHLRSLQNKIPAETQVLQTTDKLFESLADTRTPQGIAALAKIRRASMDDLLTTAGQAPLIAFLVSVQDPGNVGTVIRAAEGFGASGAIVSTGTANPWGQKSLRGSAGSALRLPILAGVGVAVAMAQLRVAGVKLVAATVGQGQLPGEFDLRGPVALLIGNEGAGLPPDVVRSVDARVRIPLAAGVDSLNAAVAASVLLYEAGRQRGFR
ncbi:MAG: RNA methyltransferase [Acidobacteria bacterium]|nr:RNA methyltransferase [Acidobacteriota bacterium]